MPNDVTHGKHSGVRAAFTEATMTLIPEAALDKHAALLGMTGSGKTSAAKSGIVEPDLEAGRRVIVIDPTAAWWGLRLHRDGSRKGFPIYIFGGDHGDYPLKAANARLLAETFATSSDSAIFDTSQMTVAERTAFFTEFAETFRRKNKGWVRFVIDEAHLFMPQSGAKGGGAVPAMLHAGNNLVSLGRSRGLRIVMISQRAAKLHKDSLTQANSLIAMQLASPQDREAIKDWVSDQADPVKGKEIIASLPSLVPGEAWVWAPQAKYLERVKFPLPSTFDSSSAPEDEQGDGPTLAPINLDALKGRLASVEAEVKANDPKLLKAELATLRRQMTEAAKIAASTGSAIDPKAVEEAERRGFDHGYTEGGDQVMRGVANLAPDLAAAVGRAEAACADARRLLDSFSTFMGALEGDRKARPQRPAPRPLAAVKPRPVSVPHSQPVPVDGLGKPQMRVLSSLAFWHSVGHEAPTREQVAGVAGYSPGTGNFGNILGGLKSSGMIDYPAAGRVHMNGAAPDIPPPSSDEAREMLLSVFSSGQRRIINALSTGETLTRTEIASCAGYEPNTGNFGNLLGSLRTLKVIDYPQSGSACLTDWARELLA